MRLNNAICWAEDNEWVYNEEEIPSGLTDTVAVVRAATGWLPGVYIITSQADEFVGAGGIVTATDLIQLNASPGTGGATNGVIDIFDPTATVTKRAVSLGNSLTAGNGSSDARINYPSIMRSVLPSGWNTVNAGVSGNTAAQMIARYAADVAPQYDADLDRNVLVIWGGTNSLFYGATKEQTLADLATLADMGRTTGFDVYLCTELPRSDSGTPGDFETNRLWLNDQLQALCVTEGYGCIDLAGEGIEPAGDLVHLDNDGYLLVADAVALEILTPPAPPVDPDGWERQFTGDFGTDAAKVGQGQLIAGIKDVQGNVLYVEDGQLILDNNKPGVWWLTNYGLVPGSDAEVDQRARVRIPANLSPGFNYYLTVRAAVVPGEPLRYSGYHLLFASSASETRCRILADMGTGAIWSMVDLGVGWYDPTRPYELELVAEETLPTMLTATVRDLTDNSVVATGGIGNDTAFGQQAGLAGVHQGTFESFNESAILPTAYDSLTVDLKAAVPPLVAPQPVLVSRATGVSTISITPEGGTPPYSVAWHRKTKDFSYTPDGSTLLADGGDVETSDSEGVFTLAHSGRTAGSQDVYKAVVTDSSDPAKTATSPLLFVEGLRPAPGALPALSAALAASGIILTTWGDSITAPPDVNDGLYAYLTTTGGMTSGKVARASAGFQGSTFADWKSDATFGGGIGEGAFNPNTDVAYTVEYGGAIPGDNCLEKALTILDDAIEANPGKKVIISCRLGMNDMLQGRTSASSVEGATDIITAARSRNALVVFQKTSYAVPIGNGPTLANITAHYATWDAIKALAEGQDDVFVHEDTTEKVFYEMYAGLNTPDPLFQGGDSVHVNTAGGQYLGSRDGEAVRRTALVETALPLTPGVLSAPTGQTTTSITGMVATSHSGGQGTVTKQLQARLTSGDEEDYEDVPGQTTSPYSLTGLTPSATPASRTFRVKYSDESGDDPVFSNEVTGTPTALTGGDPPASTVTGVTVVPSAKTVYPGAGERLTATVAGTGDFDDSVTWSKVVSGNPITLYTQADGSVIVLVAADAAPGAYQVRATSVQDGTKSATATITVQAVPTGGGGTGDGLTDEQSVMLGDIWAKLAGDAQETVGGYICKGPDGASRLTVLFPTPLTRDVTRAESLPAPGDNSSLTEEEDAQLRDIWAKVVGDSARVDGVDIYEDTTGEERLHISFPTSSARSVTRI